MAIYFIDSSALVKRYISEIGKSQFLYLLNELRSKKCDRTNQPLFQLDLTAHLSGEMCVGVLIASNQKTL
jgi:hypothetical protein